MKVIQKEIYNGLYIFIELKRYRLVLFVIAQKFFHIVFKIDIIPPLPIQVNIEVSSICNLRCPVCPTGAGSLKRAKPLMSYEDFKKIIDEIKWFTGKVYLHNYGEPFLNKDLLKMITYAKDAGLYVKLSTNGEFFHSREYARTFVESGVDYLFVSVDGKDQETHEKYRIGSDFDKVTEGFKFLTAAKKEVESSTPVIELQFLRTKNNEHQRDQMKNFAEQLGANVYAERIFGACSGDKALAEKYISDDPESTLLRVKESGTIDYAGEYINYCHWVTAFMVINSDGAVSPCIEDPFVEHTMGNIHEQSIKDIWKGKEYKKLREKIKTNRKNITVCNSCSHAKTESCLWKTEDIISH
jgi:radical SAM protein with 4Fe4S-binding SPASM domain